VEVESTSAEVYRKKP